ncbi:hypothetical protein FB563_0335 [Streptomyces puniciscabiei]|uniref:Uncharacterized protein n=1 Tax=Streptomyces puniciscabiei TaxID=164348 RepID=A0A542U8Q0_9ACTN|nr:hypothetical protein FB563_0335 [Streptomyces puniciscabiei]
MSRPTVEELRPTQRGIPALCANRPLPQRR